MINTRLFVHVYCMQHQTVQFWLQKSRGSQSMCLIVYYSQPPNLKSLYISYEQDIIESVVYVSLSHCTF